MAGGTFLNVFSRVIKRFLPKLICLGPHRENIRFWSFGCTDLDAVLGAYCQVHKLIFSQYVCGLNGGIKFVVVVVVVVTTIALG